jgi:hypothetical protein
MTGEVNVAPTQPDDRRRRLAQHRRHHVANQQILHRDLAPRGRDARAGGVAGRVQRLVIGAGISDDVEMAGAVDELDVAEEVSAAVPPRSHVP